VAAKAAAMMAFGRPKKSRTVNSSVEPSYTLSGLRSTDEIHDAEKHQSKHSNIQQNALGPSILTFKETFVI